MNCRCCSSIPQNIGHTCIFRSLAGAGQETQFDFVSFRKVSARPTDCVRGLAPPRPLHFKAGAEVIAGTRRCRAGCLF